MLKLYRLHAIALEHMGVVEETLGNYEQAREYYLYSIRQFRLAELLEPSWDPDFHLQWDLVYKRLGETEFHLEGLTEASFDQIGKALVQYRMVTDKTPEIMDAYCKIGFACTDSMEKLLKLPEDRFSVHLRKCFENYAEACRKAVEEAFDSMGAGAKRNRQLWNISCSFYRSEGVYFWRSDRKEEAEQAFEKSIEEGKSAVRFFSEHPYSYLGLAKACLAYKLYLEATGKTAAGSVYARQGREAIVVSRKYLTDQNAFEDIYQQLI